MNFTPQDHYPHSHRRVELAKYLILLVILATFVFYLSTEDNLFGTGLILLNLFMLSLISYRLLSRIDADLNSYKATIELTSHWRQQLIGLIDASIDAIFSVNQAGRIKSWNAGAENLLGYTHQDIIDVPISTLFGNNRSAAVESKWLVQTAIRDRFVRQHETICWDIHGRELFVELSATAIASDNNQSESILIVLRDVTSRKRRENEVKRMSNEYAHYSDVRAQELAEKVTELAQANVELTQLDQTRSEFVSLVSHQIRAPLTNITGAIQRMQSDCGANNSTCLRMFAIIEQQAARMDSLVSNVLNATRIEAGELVLHLEPTSIAPLVKQVIQQILARSTTDHDIIFLDKPGLPLAYADRDRVAEVLSNLLDNAYKYTPPYKAILVDVRADQNMFTVSIKDNGPGIPTEKLGQLFTKFYRIDSGDSQNTYGYGLGLYVCRLLIERQNGRIWAENHPEGGAIFSFSLPVWEH